MLQVKDLSKKYKNKKNYKEALKNINLSFEDKGLVFIVGESGSGKSTLMNLLSLELSQSSGEIILDGKEYSKLKNNEIEAIKSAEVAIVFQDLNLLDEYSIKENILLSLQITNQLLPTDDELEHIFNQYNLPIELLNSKPPEISGGEAQRVAIIRALIKKPSFIIADEPTGSLDERNSIAVTTILKDVSKDKLVIVVSHNRTLANEYADRIIELDDGVVVSDSNPVSSINFMNLELKQTKLPLIHVIKLGLTTFRTGKFRLLISMVSLVMMMTIFILAFTMKYRDEDRSLRATIRNESITVARVNIKNKNSNNDMLIDEVVEQMLFSDFATTNSILYTIELNGIIDSLRNNSLDSSSNRLNGAIALNYSQLSELKYNLIGRMPTTNSGDIEVVLTNYTCYLLGWLSKDELKNEQALKRIIETKEYKIDFYKGTSLSNEVSCKIVGIVDTNYQFPDERIPDPNYQAIFLNDIISGLHKHIIFDVDTIKQVQDAYRYYNGISNIDYSYIHLIINSKTYAKLASVDSLFYDIIVTCKISFGLNFISDTYIHLIPTALIIGCIVVFLFVISYTSLVGTIIDEKTKMIVTLKSLGMRFKSIFGIFNVQGLIIAFICVVLSIFTFISVVEFINIQIRNNYLIDYPILYINWLIVLIAFVTMYSILSILVFLILRIKFDKKKRKDEEIV